jgi:hypothetical protein
VQDALLLCSNLFSGLLLAEDLVLFFAFEAHGMMIRSANRNLQLEQSNTHHLHAAAQSNKDSFA